MHQLNKIFFSIITIFLFQNTRAGNATDTLPFKIGKLIYSDKFDLNLNKWFPEFEFPEYSKISISNNKLDLVTKRGATVWFKQKWFKQKLSGNYMITYDEIIINDGGEYDRVSDMNMFWMATNPDGNFFNKDGRFLAYDSLQLYYAGIGGNNNSTSRFRKYTGVPGDKDVIKEYTDSSHLIAGNTLYQIKIIALNGRTSLLVNNELYFDLIDKNPYRKGYFGFRTTNSHQHFSNFKIHKIKRRKQ